MLTKDAQYGNYAPCSDEHLALKALLSSIHLGREAWRLLYTNLGAVVT